jgi:hypothetical protein
VNGLSFIAAMTKALAWPVTVVFLAMLFRRPLFDLVPLLRRLKYGDLEIDFEREIRALETVADQVLPKTKDFEIRALRLDELHDEITRLAGTMPAAAVVVAWSDVERALLAAAERNNITKKEDPVHQNPIYIVRSLALRDKIDRLTLTIFSELRRLRNAATHGAQQITRSEALEFSDLAARLIDKFGKI